MPQVTVYIRAEDIEAWAKIEKKSEFIHRALNRTKPFGGQTLNEQVATVHAIIQDETPIKIPGARLANGVCTVHAIPLDARGRCLQKGCKYA